MSELIQKPLPPMTRREFLGLSLLGGATAGAAAFGLFRPGSGGGNGSGSARGESQSGLPEAAVVVQNVSEVLNDIRRSHGITIPNEINLDIYGEEVLGFQGDKLVAVDVIPNALVRYEEATIIREALSHTPWARNVVSLIVPFRKQGEDIVSGGSYMGRMWEFFLKRSGYDKMPMNFLSEDPAIKLILPEADMDSELPLSQTDLRAYLPPMLQMSLGDLPITANTHSEVPYTTHGERLRQVVIHELGHGLQDAVRIASSKNMEEYQGRGGFVPFGLIPIDTNNALYGRFAKVNGWMKVPYADVVEQYDVSEARLLREEYPDAANRLLWERDPKIWGNVADRKLRISVYGTYGPINEAMCEFLMASVLYPQLLTTEERKLFNDLTTRATNDFRGLISELAAETRKNMENESPLRGNEYIESTLHFPFRDGHDKLFLKGTKNLAKNNLNSIIRV